MPKDLIYNSTSAYRQGKRYVINEGGTRSGKTFAVLSALYVIADTVPNILISVVSETFPHLRKGAIRDFTGILQNWCLWDQSCWNKTESTYTLSTTGSQIEFFSADSPDKVHGPARDILFLNEAQNISYEIARHLFVRTSGTVFIDFNPTHEFWAHTELKADPSTYWGHSTYLDNPFLTSNQIKEIERNKRHEHWWRVYGLGLIGQLDGLVFSEFEMIDQLPATASCYGLDFGYTNDPSALIGVLIKDDTLYLDEVIYSTGLRNADLVQLMKSEGITRTVPIYADSAEPKSIDDIYLSGFNIHPATKGKDSVMWGLDLMKQYKIKITKRSTNLIKEFRNYTFAKDKEGKALNAPIDAWNHGIDAARYAVSMTQRNLHEYKTLNTIDNSRRL